MGRARSRFSRLARVRHHPRWAAPTGRPAPYPARPTRPTPPTELTTEPRNRSHTNRIRRHRITSQAAGPTSSQIYTGNGTPPSGLFADGGLELAINGTLEVADIGPEAVGGPPVNELPVGVSTGAGAVPAFQVAAFERPDGGDLGRVAGVGHAQQEVAVGPSRRMLGGVEGQAPPGRHLL